MCPLHVLEAGSVSLSNSTNASMSTLAVSNTTTANFTVDMDITQLWAQKESALLGLLMLFGLFILPLSIFLVVMCYHERHEHDLLLDCCCRIYFCCTCQFRLMCHSEYVPTRTRPSPAPARSARVLRSPMNEDALDDLEMTELNNQSVSWSHFQFPAVIAQQPSRPSLSSQIYVY